MSDSSDVEAVEETGSMQVHKAFDVKDYSNLLDNSNAFVPTTFVRDKQSMPSGSAGIWDC